jgi:Tfp pilus assembly pilus retraction ATPase PilT
MGFQALLNFAVKKGASDLHLQASAMPMLRIAGQVHAVQGNPLTNEDLQSFVASIAPSSSTQDVAGAAMKGLDT